MEPNSEDAVAGNESGKHPVFHATCFSKYLAMGLFIVLPFLGAYLGYIYVPGQVVLVEQVVIDPLTKNDRVELTSSSTTAENAFLTELGAEASMNYLYHSSTSDFSYFNLVTNSSAPSGIVRYEPQTKQFSKTDFYIDYFVSEAPSPGGRYIAKLDRYTSPTTSIYVINLENESKLRTLELSGNETLWAGECGYAGPTFTIAWLSSTTLQYGVYPQSSIGQGKCENTLLEYRQATF